MKIETFSERQPLPHLILGTPQLSQQFFLRQNWNSNRGAEDYSVYRMILIIDFNNDLKRFLFVMQSSITIKAI